MSWAAAEHGRLAASQLAVEAVCQRRMRAEQRGDRASVQRAEEERGSGSWSGEHDRPLGGHGAVAVGHLADELCLPGRETGDLYIHLQKQNMMHLFKIFWVLHA